MSLPKCGLVIATYLEQNQKYLDECLKSIKNLNYPKELLEIVIVSSGEYTPNSHGYRNIHKQNQTHYPSAVNIGIASLETAEYFFILNDDVILSKNSLINLVSSALKYPSAIMQPMSTCDNWWRYIFAMPLGLNNRFYRYEDLVGRFDEIQNIESKRDGHIIADWVPLYATLISRRIWETVGCLDDNFKTGQDDLDYGFRAKAKGIVCLIDLSAFALHFGGVTADIALTKEIRDENVTYFEGKWQIKLK